MANDHHWTFFRAGGVDQVVLKDGSDLENLGTLDQKLWVALACPTKGNEIDLRSLELVDTDNDGRIRPPEVLAAIAWMGEVLVSLDLLFEKGAALPLDALDKESEEGKKLLSSAKRILKDQNKKGASAIELADVQAMEKVLAATLFNGDGVVPPDSASSDEATRTAIEDVVKTVGSVPDRSGKAGVDHKLVDEFFEQARKVIEWQGAREAAAAIGEATDTALDAFLQVEVKVVDFFTRAKVASFDDRATTSLNASEAELTALSPKVLSAGSADLEKLPLARVKPGGALPLTTDINPAWTDRIHAFATKTVIPLLGERAVLTEADFDAIGAKLAPFRKWRTDKPANVIDGLGLDRIRTLVDSGAKEAIRALLDKDLSLQGEYLEIANVEKAIRFRRDLVKLLRNFVNFAEFYGRRGGMFQAGTLYMDARSCDLCLYVEDSAKHAALAGLSKAYLAYCDIARLNGEKARIVAAFTAGDVDNLMVGRNGVFYDRHGADWDATITNIVESPISVRQAFWSPYKRLIRLVEEQMAKRAADKEKASQARVDAAAVAAGNADTPPPPTGPTPAVPPPVPSAPAAAAPAPPAPGAPPPPAPAPLVPQKVDTGMIVGIGVAVGTICGFFTSILAMFLGLGAWMPIGILAVLLAVSGPSMVIAWLKLRQRNLGPILDASGWAVNGRARINVPFGGSLTAIAELPRGASRTAGDPFAEKPTPWVRWVLAATIVGVLLLWLLGTVDDYLPASVRFKTLIQSEAAPSAVPSATPTAPLVVPAPSTPAK